MRNSSGSRTRLSQTRHSQDVASFLKSNDKRDSSTKRGSLPKKSFVISNSTSFCRDGPKISNIASVRTSVFSQEANIPITRNTLTHRSTTSQKKNKSRSNSRSKKNFVQANIKSFRGGHTTTNTLLNKKSSGANSSMIYPTQNQNSYLQKHKS